MSRLPLRGKDRRNYDPLEGSDSDSSDAVSEFLSWRQDPAVNLSDWSIHVIPEEGKCQDVLGQAPAAASAFSVNGLINIGSSDSETSETNKVKTKQDPFGEVYHVHKSVLAATSDYFYNLFHTTLDTQEVALQCSIIRLEQAACDAFPLLLDYVYNPSGLTKRQKESRSASLRSDNASSVRFLANYFRIRDLYHVSSKFIRQDMDPQNFLTYLEGAHIFTDSTLREVVVKFCAKNIDHISEDALIQVPMETFEEILEVFLCQYWNAVEDRHFSLKLVSYVEAYPDFYKTVTFRSLMKEENEELEESLQETDERKLRPQLRSVHPKAALRFLQLDHIMAAYPCFRRHCANVCSTYWQRIPLWDEECSLPLDLADKVHKDALSRARHEIESLQWFVFDLLRSSFDEMDRKNENFFRSFIYTSRLMRRMTGEIEASRNEEFVAQHRHSLPKRISVADAGIELVNGNQYDLIGCRNGFCVYSNGDFMISRFSREPDAPQKWYFSWPSPEGNPSHDLIFYENEEDQERVPGLGWKNFKSRRTWAEGPPIVRDSWD
jgi:hypothetical protein